MRYSGAVAATENFTDPESRIMETSQEGFQQCGNAQVVAEGKNQLVVATEAASDASDQEHPVPLLNGTLTSPSFSIMFSLDNAP